MWIDVRYPTFTDGYGYEKWPRIVHFLLMFLLIADEYNKDMASNTVVIPPVVQKLMQSAQLRRIPKGQIILYEGDMLRDVFIIKSGVVKLYDIDEQGNEKILHIVKTPAVVPFAFFSGVHNALKWFYVTLTDCELCMMPADELRSRVKQDSELAEVLTNAFSQDVHELLVRLSSLGKTNIQDKVAAALRFLLERHATKQRSGRWRVDFPVSHQLIADLCGITRESAAIVMKEFQKKKIVSAPQSTVLEIERKRLLGYTSD